MKTKWLQIRDKIKSFWTERSRRQKGIFIGSVALVLILIIAIVFFTSRSSYVPLYNDLYVEEIGQIKEELDSRDISYKVTDNGTTIKVPDSKVDSLMVDLAGEGIPDSGNIDYFYISENASWGNN